MSRFKSSLPSESRLNLSLKWFFLRMRVDWGMSGTPCASGAQPSSASPRNSSRLPRKVLFPPPGRRLPLEVMRRTRALFPATPACALKRSSSRNAPSVDPTSRGSRTSKRIARNKTICRSLRANLGTVLRRVPAQRPTFLVAWRQTWRRACCKCITLHLWLIVACNRLCSKRR